MQERAASWLTRKHYKRKERSVINWRSDADSSSDGGIDPQRFPGEGRGPVEMVGVTGGNLRQFRCRDWTPAFAGEARIMGHLLWH